MIEIGIKIKSKNSPRKIPPIPPIPVEEVEPNEPIDKKIIKNGIANVIIPIKEKKSLLLFAFSLSISTACSL